MTVSRIDAEHINPRLYQGSRAVEHIRADADGRSGQQPTARIFGRSRVIALLLNVFDGDEPLETPIVIDQGKLFDAMLLQNALGFFEGRPQRGNNQVVRGHVLADRLAIIVGKTNVSVGQDTDELGALDDGHAGYVVMGHNPLGLCQSRGRGQCDRVYDHARFGAFNLVYLGCLGLNRTVAMNDPQAPFPSQGNRHTSLGDSVHRRRE